jgi:DNA-binding MarR family transcriptional regulator
MQARRRAIGDIQQAVSLVVRNVRQPRLGRFIGRRVGISLGGAYPGILPYISRAQPVRVSDLAQMMQVEIPTVSRQLKSLSERGLIARSPHPDDGRSTLVSFTPTGRTVYDRLFDAWLLTLDEVLAEWPDAEVVAFASHLRRFGEALAEFVDAIDDDGVSGLSD